MPKSLTNPTDIVGAKFGKLTIDEYIGKQLFGKQNMHAYRCHCDCGTQNIITNRSILLKGDKKSCGCAHKDAGDIVLEDLTGQIFGRWTVIERAPTRRSASGKTRSIMWKCKCSCGTIKNVGARALKTGMSMSCGCLQKERVSNALTKNLIGQRFGYLTVVNRNGSYTAHENVKGGIRAIWHCKCDCGNECDVLGQELLNGNNTSCGCKKISKYEMYVMQYLEILGYIQNIDYIREKTFKNFKGIGGQNLRFDFYVKLKTGEEVLIECQGEQHYHSVKWFGGNEYLQRLQTHDQMKRQFAKDNNYRLIEIPYTKVLYSDIEQFLKDNFVY